MSALQPAKLTDRFLAYLADILPFFAGYFAGLYVMVMRLHRLPNTVFVWTKAAGVWLGLYLFYQALGNLSGATLGKRLLGLRVVSLEGGRLSLGRSLARAFGYLLSTPMLNLGFLWSLFEPRSRTWHDLLAGSMVVEVRAKPPAASLAAAGACAAILALVTAANLWFFFGRPTPQDRDAVRKAREGLAVLAAIEEMYKAGQGVYTDRLADLAQASGDVETFKRAMGELFDQDSFRLSVSKERYWIRGRAKDRRRSVVALEGPAAR